MKSRFPHVDLVVGAKSIDAFPDLINKHFKKRANFNWFNESESAFGQGGLRVSGQPLSLGNKEDSAFVTIMRGCNYSCSYCIVPSVRGREIYRDPQEILQEIQEKTASGQTKVMLLGQTVNSFWFRNADGRLSDFSDLVEQVQLLERVEEIRFMSPHPHYMSDKLIATLGRCDKISPEIHMPVQSGSNDVLKRMKRNYTVEEFTAIAQKMRAAIPNLRLSTDFIVWFPQETETDFEQTLQLTKNVEFSIAYCFKYSPRATTESAAWLDDISTETKENRLARLLERFQ